MFFSFFHQIIEISMQYLLPDYEYKILKEQNYNRIVGVDEVGRGAWAGPVYVGTYSFDIESKPIEGIHDSKQLSLNQRHKAFDLLKKDKFKLFSTDVDDIDKIGIGKTLLHLINSIISFYKNSRTLILIDGYFVGNFPRNVQLIKKGDMQYYSIAAASILAKITRDELMQQIHSDVPYYKFDSNVGYGTKAHRDALAQYGVSKYHRKSYKPIKDLLSK